MRIFFYISSAYLPNMRVEEMYLHVCAREKEIDKYEERERERKIYIYIYIYIYRERERERENVHRLS